ncbi:MAG TPA: DUF2946 family protein [Methyloceanibacter sp.]|nr:DUF2946 family protein [Methyloceanibacter sp.]
MGLAELHGRRRPAAISALIGMTFYAMLFPWHTVSQTSLLLAQAGFATSTVPICHTEAPGDPAKPAQPAKQTHCPICNGFAALQFALAGTSIAPVLPPQISGKHAFGTDDHLGDAVVQSAQSRAPPSQSA